MTATDRDRLAAIIANALDTASDEYFGYSDTADPGYATLDGNWDLREVADLLIAAGVTLPYPTAETRTEWGVRYRSSDGDEYTHASTSRYRAEHVRDEILAEEPHFAPTLVKRTVTTTTWTTPEEAS